jgi:multidrug efflux system membrane fusion protein
MRSRTLKAAVAIAVIALLFGIAVYARTAQEKTKENQARQAQQQTTVPVSTITVTTRNVAIFATGIGTVTPLYSVLVRTRVDGQLERVGFVEGQSVKAGDLLAQIDPRPFQAQLAQFEAQKVRDEAQLKNSILDLERFTTLWQQDSIARQQLDTQRAAVDQLKATIQLDQAQIDNAKVQLGYTTIRSPITGRTGVRLVDPGNIVHATDTSAIVMVNQLDPISVLFTLPEDMFRPVSEAKTRSGVQSLAVKAYARTDGALLGSGKLTLINNQIDTATGTFQLRAVFPNGSNALWPGQYVNVRLILNVLENATTIPESAVQRGPQGLYVYAARDDHTVAAQPVQIARVQEGLAIVEHGITPGERIVVDGQYKLKPGVKIVESSAGARRGREARAEPQSNVGNGASR